MPTNKAFQGKTIAGALAIGAGSVRACADIVHACQGNKCIALAGLPTSFDIPFSHLRPGLSLQLLWLLLRFLVSYISIQMTFRMRHIRTKVINGGALMDNEVSKVVYEDFLPQALADGHYLAAPEPVVVGKGLDHIQAGLDAQMQGVSAKKVVVSL